ncbi:MAG: hypothetical protein ABSG25_00695 [Bryobacteraceae bacterium]
MRRSQIHFFWRDRSVGKRFRTGVSLHSHTLHSEESLAFIPRYTAGIPLVSDAIRHQARRYRAVTGRSLDFSRGFWRPPLAPREAYDLEKRQVREKVGVEALVSLTDHDDIQAGSVLRVVEPHVPVSVEWTVPFGPTFFHIGVHNLPPQRAVALMPELAAFTAAPSKARLGELLAALDELPEVLMAMNHPLWDEARIGTEEHAQLVGRFLERFGERVHALELNGMRSWRENRRVIWLAKHSGHTLVSGGDRHGLEPNANLNLTNARSFPEFVAEVRGDGISEILFMPQYREPLRVRMIETMRDAVRNYADLPVGRRRWSDRVFYKLNDGTVKPLSAYWHGDGPWPVKWFLGGLRAMTSQQVRTALCFALADPQEARL